MAPIDLESPEAIRVRLIALRLAVEPNSSAFARRVGISPQAWANFESDTVPRRISIDAALQLCRRLGVTLDWIYRGNEYLMPAGLLDEIKAQAPEHRKRKSRA